MSQHAPPLLTQERAKFALERVQGIEEARKREYRSLIEGFPALVRSAGIGQALALLLKGEKAQLLLAGHLCGWVNQRGYTVGSAPADFMAWLAKADRDSYLAVQKEVMAICGWLKTFAQAFLPAGS